VTSGRRPFPPPTRGRERLTPQQEASLDALVARYGDGRISVLGNGVAELIHPFGTLAWLVNPEGDVAEWAAEPTYTYSRQEVQRWPQNPYSS
jgi:hypothetical protein